MYPSYRWKAHLLENRLQNRKSNFLCYILSSPTDIFHYYDLPISTEEGKGLVFLFLQVRVVLPTEGADNSGAVGSTAAINRSSQKKQNIKHIR